jgi:hypothetical protein
MQGGIGLDADQLVGDKQPHRVRRFAMSSLIGHTGRRVTFNPASWPAGPIRWHEDPGCDRPGQVEKVGRQIDQ